MTSLIQIQIGLFLQFYRFKSKIDQLTDHTETWQPRITKQEAPLPQEAQHVRHV